LKKRVFALLVLLYIFLTAILAGNAYAEDANSKKDMGGFNFEVIHPENQVDKKTGYFDLKMTPGQKQVVQIKLTNPSDIETTISVKLNGAKSNSNGVIEYGPTVIENDASLKYDFVDIVKGPDEVKIPPKGEKTIDLDITMPESSYDGIITGGIEMQNITNEEQKPQSGSILNKYAYLVGMILKETDTEVKPELSLNKVYANQKNYRNTVFVNFSNTQATFIEDMTVDVQVSGKGSDQVLYDTKKAAMRMAPNSMLDFPVSMQGERMVAGDYSAHIIVTAGADRWEWDQDFTITDEEADKFNAEDVSLLQESKINWTFIAGIVGGLFVLVIVTFFIVRKVGKKTKKKKRKKQPGTKPSRK